MIQSLNLLVNNPSTLIKEVLSTAVACNPNLYNIPETQILTLINIPKTIGLLCGGGSGHEPAHTYFVNESILQAAVSGLVFASPTYLDVYEAIKYIHNNNNNKGVIVIIKNYQGDLMNFGLAVQQALSEGIKIRSIIVQDDVVFIHDQEQSSDLHQQRRGLSGTVLLYKILGAAKFESDDLESLYQLGLQVNQNLFTIGVGINEKSEYESPNIEIGLGIHGEKGLMKIPFLKSKELMEKILGMFHKFIQQGDEVVVLLNNLGSLADLEISQYQHDLLQYNKQLQWKIKILITGRAMTSINMKGFSITLLKLSQIQEKSSVIKYLLSKTDCAAWNGLNISVEPDIPFQKKLMKYITNLQSRIITPKEHFQILTICQELEKLEDYFNKLDAEVGDGDLGNTVKSGCKAVQDLLLNQQEVRIFDIANKLAQSTGGSFGPLFSTFVFGIDKGGLREGLRRLKELGQANVGDRTVIDVLEPLIFQQDLYEENPNWKLLLQYAESFAERASQLKALKGRSRYLAGKEIGHPDPGCELIVEIIKILSKNE